MTIVLKNLTFAINRFFYFSLFLAVCYSANSQNKNEYYHKFEIGGFIINEINLNPNAIYSNFKNHIFDGSSTIPDDVLQDPDISPNSIMEINSMVLGSLHLGYNFNQNNKIILTTGFSSRYNDLRIDDKTSGIGRNTSFGDPMFNLVYYKTIFRKDILSIKIGLGGGVIFNSIDALNSIYKGTNLSTNSYKGKNAYFFQDNKYVFTTEERYRTELDVNLTPRVQMDFSKSGKHTISLLFGLNIMPFSYIGVQSQIIDINSGQVINSLNSNFKNTTFFIGLGYSFGWAQSSTEQDEYDLLTK